MAETVAKDVGGKTGPGGLLNFDALRQAGLRTEPYNYFVAAGALSADEAADVRRDYPAINKPGYLPLSKLEASGEFKRLMEDLNSAELAQVLSDKFGVFHKICCGINHARYKNFILWYFIFSIFKNCPFMSMTWI